MRPAFFDDPLYRKKQSENTKLYLKLHPRIKKIETRICNSPDCQLPFQVKPADHKIYCSHACAAHITNTLRKGQRVHPCRACGKPTKRSVSIFCSLKCQQYESYSKYIKRWKLGLESGVIGISTKTISAYLRRYLVKKYGSLRSRSYRWQFGK